MIKSSEETLQLSADCWLLILLNIPYFFLGKLARVFKPWNTIIKTPHFWYLKTKSELKGVSIDKDKFDKAVSPRLLYVRTLGLNHIYHEGFEVYFSPFEIVGYAAKIRNNDLLSYILSYVMRNGKTTRQDWLAIQLADSGYLEEGYQLVTRFLLGCRFRVPFFYQINISETATNKGERGLTPDKLEELCRGNPGARKHGEICLKVALGTYTQEEIDEFPLHVYYDVAVQYKRFDLLSNSIDPFTNLINRKEYAELDRLIIKGEIDLSKITDVFETLCYEDSKYLFFSILLSRFDGCIDRRDAPQFFRSKPIHDLNGFRLVLTRVPKETINQYMKHLPGDCPLAKILCEERLAEK